MGCQKPGDGLTVPQPRPQKSYLSNTDEQVYCETAKLEVEIHKAVGENLKTGILTEHLNSKTNNRRELGH